MTVAVVGAATIGARSTSVTVIDVLAVVACELVAVKLTLYGPGGVPNGGVQLNVPVVSPGPFVNVAPGGSVPCVSVIAWPSGSSAWTMKLVGAPGWETVEGR